MKRKKRPLSPALRPVEKAMKRKYITAATTLPCVDMGEFIHEVGWWVGMGGHGWAWMGMGGYRWVSLGGWVGGWVVGWVDG